MTMWTNYFFKEIKILSIYLCGTTWIYDSAGRINTFHRRNNITYWSDKHFRETYIHSTKLEFPIFMKLCICVTENSIWYWLYIDAYRQRLVLKHIINLFYIHYYYSNLKKKLMKRIKHRTGNLSVLGSIPQRRGSCRNVMWFELVPLV